MEAGILLLTRVPSCKMHEECSNQHDMPVQTDQFVIKIEIQTIILFVWGTLLPQEPKMHMQPVPFTQIKISCIRAKCTMPLRELHEGCSTRTTRHRWSTRGLFVRNSCDFDFFESGSPWKIRQSWITYVYQLNGQSLQFWAMLWVTPE